MKNYNFKMSDNIKIPVFENFKDSAHLTKDKYEETYKFALDNPEAFVLSLITILVVCRHSLFC